MVSELISFIGLIGALLFGFGLAKQNYIMIWMGGIMALFGISRFFWLEKLLEKWNK